MHSTNLALLAGLMAMVNVAQQPPVQSSRQFSCTPKTVMPGGAVELHFDGPHGRELGVRTPDKGFLFIAFEQETADSVPPVPSARFRSMRSLKLEVATARGLEYIGSKEPQQIFKAFGMYRFVVSDNLETEDETETNRTCEVQFSDARRR